jgi:hypothetical protein
MAKIIVIMAALAIGIGASLTLGTSTGFATQSDTGTGMAVPFPGGGNPLFCSPGFWKNHPEVWEAGICCIGMASDPQSQCGELDAQLRAKGPGGNLIREAAQAVLSACFAEAPCDSD